MCGIAGIVTSAASRYNSNLEAMIKVQHHRGPDGNGIHAFENCILGHNRLSIVDLETGDQPMLSNDRRRGIVFNGEIYGYKSIRDSIAYDYHTTSDTEVIIAMYEKYGTGLAEHLPGMFSFALWDDEMQTMFAARDRFGEKPFFYAIGENGEFVFASEIKTVLASGVVKPEIDRASISKFIGHGYTGPLHTIYSNVHVLPPAHSLVYKDGKVAIQRYWNLPAQEDSLSLSEAAEKFEALFTEAIRKQMIADVEVCSFLSGGLDSTSVVSIARQFNPSLKTLAFGYDNEDNELPFAKIAAEMYGTDHHELREENLNILEYFLNLADIYDEPFADSSALATFAICRLASEKCKVVLTGDGGDELLGGYTWWYQPVVNEIAARGIGGIKEAFVNVMAVAEKVKEVGTGNVYNRKWRSEYLAIKNAKNGISPVDSVQSRFHVIDSNELNSLQLPDVRTYTPSWQLENNINDAMKFDIEDYMAGDILVKTDRASMANSLELRSPFLDVDLASFCISMPGNFKIDKNADKILLRSAMEKHWPKEIAKRSKQGFGVTKDDWMNAEKTQRYYKEYVHDKSSPLYNILPYEEAINLVTAKPKLTHALFLLAVWLEKKYF